MHKTIRSRSNKNIGDLLEDKWEITAKTVIAEPHVGEAHRGTPPRLGIYEYDVKLIGQLEPPKSRASEPKLKGPNVGGTRREASSVPLTVRRTS